MKAVCVDLLLRTKFVTMSEIYSLKGENNGLLHVFGDLPKVQMNVLPKKINMLNNNGTS